MNPVIISIIAISVILIGTTIGSTFVFFLRKNLSKKTYSLIMGFASGIMIAAAFFGLVNPAIASAQNIYGKNIQFLPVLIGFLIGGLILYGLDKLLPHFHISTNEEEGKKSNFSRNLKFFFAVTIHNIPEGLAVGFACGVAFTTSQDLQATALMSALSLSIGIAIQNIPEGIAVSVPLMESGFSKPKAFLFGVLSGVVEPIFAVLGLFLLQSTDWLLPWLLAFAAGAMIYVTVDELIPSMREYGHFHRAIWAFMIGFSIMMVLELVFQ